MLSVSVVIPTYNGAAFIQEALSSVFAQTLPPREIIVVDDCSTDDTPTIVKNIASGSPIPIRLIRLQDNSGGPAKPINMGVAAAQSELIAVLDQDDLFARNKLEQEASLLACHPKAVLAGGMVALASPPNTPLPYQLNPFRELGANLDSPVLVLPGLVLLRHLVLHGNFLVGYPGFTFRKSHWSAKGGVDEGLPVASDYDFLCWLCSQGTVVLCPAVHYFRREHTSNVCNDCARMFLDVARVRARYLRTHRWLLQEDAVSGSMREFFTGFGYWLREAGNYRAALECHRLMMSIWGLDQASLKAMLKLPLHWLWRRVHGGENIYTGYTARISKPL